MPLHFLLALALPEFLLAQAAPETGTNTTSIIRIVAGVLALVFIVVILLRRKRKSSKEDWS